MRDPVKESLELARTIRLPVRDGKMVIPPSMLTPGDSIVIDIYGHVTIQRGGLVSARLMPQTEMGPFEWPAKPA